MGKGKSLPAGYILPKGKKQYGSGRPIIGFFNAPFKPMLSTLAKLLFQLVPRACPEHFAHGDVYQLLKLLREYATKMADKDLRIYNQDLSGFFISIDSDRFLQSWYMLLRFLEPSMSVHENEFFSVSPVKQNNPGDIIKGRTFRTLNVNRHIRIGDIPELIIAALQMQNFQLGSKVYTQAQGSPMGSPLSPALCLMVVSVYEQIWFHTHRESISNLHLHALFLRYVDNRLVIFPSSTKDLPAFQVLVDPHFYKAPIILETEPDQEFLGFQRKRTWTRSWSAFWNKGSKNLLLPLLTVAFLGMHLGPTLHGVLFLFLGSVEDPFCFFLVHRSVAMPSRNRARHTRTLWDVDASLHHALDQIPTSPMTVQQKSSFLDHIAKVLWTTSRTFPLPGIFQNFLKHSINHFLTYKSSLGSLWKQAPMHTIPLGPASWLSWLQLQQMKKTSCYSLRSNICIVCVHLSTDLPAQLSSIGYGNIIVTLCRDKLLNFSMCKHSLIFLNKGTINFGTIGPTTLLVKKAALNTQPSWLGVCVYLLKRSKTCIFPWWFFTWRTRLHFTSLHFIQKIFYMMSRGARAIMSSLVQRSQT